MSEMTLEQIRDELRNSVSLVHKPSFSRLDELADAIDAHLTHDPVQVTDEDVERAMRVHDEHRKNGHPMYRAAAMRAALESLSARPAHSVVAKVPNEGFVGRAYHAEGIRLATEALLSQPHPQAAQGGEAQAKARHVAEIADINGAALCAVVDIKSPNVLVVGDRLYLHPAERAAVPEGWQSIDTAPTDGQRVLLWAKEWSGPWAGNFRQGQWGIIPQDCDLVPQPTHWMPLPAAPTLAGKEK